MHEDIILLFGGESEERLVSVASAQYMLKALSNCRLWFINKAGEVFEITDKELSEHKDAFNNEFIPGSEKIFDTLKIGIRSLKSKNVVFVLAFHGGSGENGQIQQLLENEGFLFTGSKAKASRLSFDKMATKGHLMQYDIRMPPDDLLDKNNIKQSLISFFNIYGTMIIKPIADGSSIDCYFVYNLKDIDEPLIKAIENKNKEFMMEKLIEGKEITVGVIENETELTALPPTEINLEKGKWFDYNSKYLDASCNEITPAKIKESDRYAAQRMAIAAHAALGLDGYSRTDMILHQDGCYYLETNTLPGLTKNSLIPKQLSEAGITMREFLLNQIKLTKSMGLKKK